MRNLVKHPASVGVIAGNTDAWRPLGWRRSSPSETVCPSCFTKRGLAMASQLAPREAPGQRGWLGGSWDFRSRSHQNKQQKERVPIIHFFSTALQLQ